MRQPGMVVRALFCGFLLLALFGSSGCGSSSPVNGAAGGSEVEADYFTGKTPPLATGQFEIITLSALPDAVTDNDVLVGIRGVGAGDTVQVFRNGDEVTSVFKSVGNGEWRGLVAGLNPGSNSLGATLSGSAGKRSASLTVLNHPISGPVFSGPHQQPFICETVAAGLGPALDADCSVKTAYQWFYRSAVDQSFQELKDPYAAYPLDTMQVRTAAGKTVPFVARVESSTINRGITRIAVLDDPHARGKDAPFDAAEWDQRIYYAFGEACGVGYHQGTNTPNYVLGGIPNSISSSSILITLVGASDRLGQGDIVVHNTQSAFGNYCNPLVSAETLSMVKEHISEQYGLVQMVIGTNGSGAALQQYNAINNNPGLLSGALPDASFADVFTTAKQVVDCGLLTNYFGNASPQWSSAQQNAVEGAINTTVCTSWNSLFLPDLDPTNGCDPVVPMEQRYNASTNPNGIRCTLEDADVNIVGRDPQTGYARLPYDNVGVQYGLGALNAGKISFDQFIDINSKLGGYDHDGKPQAQRNQMSDDLAQRAYQIGEIIGRGALAQTPIIDLGVYLDLIPLLNIHQAVYPFTIRERLRKQTGQDATQALWRGILVQGDAYPTMDKWVTALQGATYTDRVQAVTAAKPADASDRCVIAALGGRLELPSALIGPLGIELPLLPNLPVGDVNIPLQIDIPEQFDTPTSPVGPCQTILPVFQTPRLIAGEPLSNDIAKCQLKAVDAADYSPALSAAQLQQVQQLFPQGVCDWSRPSVGDVAHSMLWPSIGATSLEDPHQLKWRMGRSGT